MLFGDLLSSAIITTDQHNPGINCLKKSCRGIDDCSVVGPNQHVRLEVDVAGQEQSLGGGGGVAGKQNPLVGVSDPDNQR